LNKKTSPVTEGGIIYDENIRSGIFTVNISDYTLNKSLQVAAEILKEIIWRERKIVKLWQARFAQAALDPQSSASEKFVESII